MAAPIVFLYGHVDKTAFFTYSWQFYPYCIKFLVLGGGILGCLGGGGSFLLTILAFSRAIGDFLLTVLERVNNSEP